MDAATGTAGPAPLAGRLRERLRLEHVLAEAAEQHPGVVFVHGEPGVGKTRLVTEVCARAGDHPGPHVLSGRCLPFGATSSPYLPLVTAFESLLADQHEHEQVAAQLTSQVPTLQELLPSLGAAHSAPPAPGAPAAVGGWWLTAWERALGVLCDDAPSVLVVDDVQWADATSLDVLAYLASGLRRQRLAILITYRDTELPDGHPLHGWLAVVRRLPPAQDLPLSRLTEPETREQMTRLLDREPHPQLVSAVWERSRGNPYLTELLLDGVPPDADGLPDGLPDALRGALLADWHRLTGRTREVVRLLAVSGHPSSPAHLARVARRRDDRVTDIHPQLHEAAGAGVLTTEPSGDVWFRHSTLAEVLYDTLLLDERTELHGAFAEAYDLDDAGEDPDLGRLADRARHCERCGRIDDAFEYTLGAAEQARRVRAVREEATLLGRAVELWPRASPVVREPHGCEADLLAAAGYAARWAGDEVTAARLSDRARRLVDASGDPLTAARVITSCAEVAFTSGATDGPPIDEFAAAAQLSGSFPDSAEHARALSDLAQSEMWRGDTEAARRHAELAVAAARRCGDLAQLSHALGTRSLVHFGDASAMRDADDCQRLAEQSGQPEYVALACLARFNALEGLGRFADCSAVLLEGYQAARRVGVGGLTPYLALGAVYNLLGLGDLRQAEQLLREVLATRLVGITGTQAHVLAAVTALRQDDLPRAESHLHAARQLVPRFAHQPGLHVPSALAEHLLAVGRPWDALRMLRATIEGHARAEPRYADELLVWGARAAADWAAGADPVPAGTPGLAGQALNQLVAERAKAQVPPFTNADPVGRALHARYRAELARLTNAPDAPDLWRAAVDETAAADLRYASMEAMLRLAECLARLGRRADSAAPLRQAYRSASQAGASTLQRELAALARLTRVDLAEPVVPSSAPEVEPGYRGLTRREREVLAHLVAGRSYAEIAQELFISEKTVSVHVSNVLRKTGTANRVAAAMWARRHGAVSADVAGAPDE